MQPAIQENVPLGPRTTIGLGGPSRYFAECSGTDDIRFALSFAAEKGLPVLVLGGGSNLVLSDEGFVGLALSVASRGVSFGPEQSGRVLVEVAAGEVWDDFVRACVERSLGGVECLSGIPGRAGGTPIQNVGAYGQETSEVVHAVRVLDTRSLEEYELAPQECGFAYRRSRFKAEDRGRFVVTAVTFALQADARGSARYAELRRALGDAADASTLAQVREAVLNLRRHKSMVYEASDPHSHSCGSFFVNPIVPATRRADLQKLWPDLPAFEQPDGTFKLSAAFLVERSGFPKGLRAGGVGISARHSLALVNYGGSSAELVELAGRIQAGVRERTGVDLVTEPEILDPEGRLRT